jgi:hypothetical protein
VFGLYRDGTELRALYMSKKTVGVSACLSLGMQCDYPIMLGNDPLYGGKIFPLCLSINLIEIFRW